MIPELIEKKDDSYSMQYAPITALLVEAIKELKAENEVLRAESEVLKAIICEEFHDKSICQ